MSNLPRPARDGEIGDLLDDYGRDERNYAIEDNSEYGRSQTMVDQRDHERQESRAAVLAAVAALRAEVTRLVSAIDNELVCSGELGTFELGDDPKAALRKLACWNQSVGAHFAARAASGKDTTHA